MIILPLNLFDLPKFTPNLMAKSTGIVCFPLIVATPIVNEHICNVQWHIPKMWPEHYTHAYIAPRAIMSSRQNTICNSITDKLSHDGRRGFVVCIFIYFVYPNKRHKPAVSKCPFSKLWWVYVINTNKAHPPSHRVSKCAH